MLPDIFHSSVGVSNRAHLCDKITIGIHEYLSVQYFRNKGIFSIYICVTNLRKETAKTG